MESNREVFFDMRAGAMANLYDATFTKKEATATGKNLVINMLESGEVDKMQFIANLARLNEVISSAMTEARQHIPFDKQKVMGVEFNPVDGGNTVVYTDDPIYCQLKEDLDARVELLKLAQKQPIIDAFGEDVPKCSTKPRASSITIKF